jgi:hypothetical protein
MINGNRTLDCKVYRNMLGLIIEDIIQINLTS